MKYTVAGIAIFAAMAGLIGVACVYDKYLTLAVFPSPLRYALGDLHFLLHGRVLRSVRHLYRSEQVIPPLLPNAQMSALFGSGRRVQSDSLRRCCWLAVL